MYWNGSPLGRRRALQPRALAWARLRDGWCGRALSLLRLSRLPQRLRPGRTTGRTYTPFVRSAELPGRDRLDVIFRMGDEGEAFIWRQEDAQPAFSSAALTRVLMRGTPGGKREPIASELTVKVSHSLHQRGELARAYSTTAAARAWLGRPDVGGRRTRDNGKRRSGSLVQCWPCSLRLAITRQRPQPRPHTRVSYGPSVITVAARSLEDRRWKLLGYAGKNCVFRHRARRPERCQLGLAARRGRRGEHWAARKRAPSVRDVEMSAGG